METNRIVTVSWAAGLFEGEGTVGIVKNRVVAAIHMTDRDILEKMLENFGGKIYDCKKQQEHHKESWKWVISSSEFAIEFLNEIYPFMGTRRKAKIDEARNAYKNHRKNRVNSKVAEVKELREQGLTHQAIADKLGIDRTYVSHMLRGRHG